MSLEPVCVAHVITRLDVGGAQETAVRICAGLDRSRFRPLLLTGSDPGSGGSLREEARRRDVEVVEVRSLHGPIRPVSDLCAGRDLAIVLRERGARVVHTHSSKAGVLGRIAARHAKSDVVVHSVHGWSFNPSQPLMTARGYEIIERTMARWTDALVVVSEQDLDAGVQRSIAPRDKFALIRSGIRVDEQPLVDRTGVRRSLGWAPDEYVVISVGRLERQKDPMTMLRAFATAAATVPRLRLAFVGSGSLSSEVAAEIASSGLHRHVELLGLRSNVADLLGAADCFALSSRFEGLPRTVLEAVRAGLPVVATDTGGIRDVIREGISGRLVPIGDAAALAGALIELASEPTQAQAFAAAARKALPQFDESRMVDDTQVLYERLLASPSRVRGRAA
jgi:glycosyltransferase involved in cell wall biosynthesis